MKFSTLSISLLATILSPLSGVDAFSVVPGVPAISTKSTTNLFVEPIMVEDGDDSLVTATTPSVKSGPTMESMATSIAPGIRLTGGEKLREEGLTGKGVKVGVIDDGIDADHPGFEGKVVQQVWWHGGGGLSHGTHVAGTIHMMAPDADIYDYRALGQDGSGSYEQIAAAVNEAVADGCDIINMSLGGPGRTWGLYRAIRDAHRKGVIIVCAAGNEGDANPLTNEISYPANFRQAMSIAAVSKQDNLPTAYFSNTNNQVDYAGIGVDVISFRSGGGFVSNTGTSMACPHVCGFLTALLTKGGEYEGTIKDDESCRDLINDKFLIDIGREGKDRSTGLGYLTYLTKDEFESQFFDLPDYASATSA